MLIYNHNKEFIGIDDESLKLLGFSTFNELLAEHKDIAALFVKKPGYIHDFKNFPWIDFILHADAEESKAIIQGRNRSFSCQLDIAPLYLNDAPEKEAYLIKLKHIQTVQLSEEERIQATIPEPVQPPAEAPLYAPEPEQPAPAAAEIPSFEPAEEAPSLETAGTQEEAPSFQASEPTPLDDIHLDVFADSDEEKETPLYYEPEPVTEEAAPQEEPPSVEPEVAEAPAMRPMLGDYINKEEQAYLDNLETDKDYIYDPHVASDELGLPVDLIEEFIGDFINQAHEFREGLFTAARSDDFDNVKILSHKLKGVAANLRIEDAFEVLNIINESNDAVEIEANLKHFYNIIAKLEGKEAQEYAAPAPQAQPEPEPTVSLAVEEEMYTLEPKFEEPAPTAPAEQEEEMYRLEPKFEEPPAPIPEAASEPEEELYDFGLDLEPEAPRMDDVKEEQREVFPEVETVETPSGVSTPTETTETIDVERVKPIRYDANAVALELGLNSELVQALIKDYVDEADEMRQMFDDAFAATEANTWQELAIKLKGVSDNLRMNEISAALQKLIATEDKVEARHTLDEFYGYIHQLT